MSAVRTPRTPRTRRHLRQSVAQVRGAGNEKRRPIPKDRPAPVAAIALLQADPERVSGRIGVDPPAAPLSAGGGSSGSSGSAPRATTVAWPLERSSTMRSRWRSCASVPGHVAGKVLLRAAEARATSRGRSGSASRRLRSRRSPAPAAPSRTGRAPVGPGNPEPPSRAARQYCPAALPPASSVLQLRHLQPAETRPIWSEGPAAYDDRSMGSVRTFRHAWLTVQGADSGHLRRSYDLQSS